MKLTYHGFSCQRNTFSPFNKSWVKWTIFITHPYFFPWLCVIAECRDDSWYSKNISTNMSPTNQVNFCTLFAIPQTRPYYTPCILWDPISQPSLPRLPPSLAQPMRLCLKCAGKSEGHRGGGQISRVPCGRVRKAGWESSAKVFVHL
jgi:hypothetical protein